MPIIKLDDIFQAELWSNDLFNEAPELKNILDSGILINSDAISSLINNMDAGSRFELPYVDEPDYIEPEYMNDSDTEVTPRKISWANQFAVLTLASTTFGYANIVNQLKRDSDPALMLRNIIGNYWGRDLQARIIASIKGIAKKAGDELTLDVADDSTDQPDVLLTPEVIIDGVSKQGDYQDKFSFMFVHSKVYADLKKQDLIETIQPAEVGAKPIQMYGNYRVIVNDLMPTEDGINKRKYTTIIAQNGLFAYGEKELGSDMPIFEVDRNPRAGKGAGRTLFISRKGFCLHPIGFSWTKSGFNPKLVDLANDTYWSMKFKPKQQKFVRIITN